MSLPPRGHCLNPDCRSSEILSNGQTVSVLNVIHPYGNHAALHPQNIDGAPLRYENLSAGCGGLIILPLPQRFNPTLKCSYCGKPWMAHSAVSSFNLLRAPEPALKAAPPHRTKSSKSTVVPTSIPSALDAGTTSTFPKAPAASSSSSNVFARSSAFLLPPAAAFAHVLDAPIADFSKRVNSAATVQTLRTESMQRLSPSRSRTASGSRTTGSRPEGPVEDTYEPRPNSHVYQICMLPFKNEKQYYENGEPVFSKYSMCTAESLPRVLRTLSTHHLVTNLLVHNNTNLWSKINTHLLHHLEDHRIRLTPASPSTSESAESSAYELRAWELLVFRGSQAAENRSLYLHSFVERQWDFDNLAKLLKKCLHPEHKHLEMMFVAPRYENLHGPLGRFDIDQHPCFPWSVYWPFMSVKEGQACSCISGCPGYEDAEAEEVNSDDSEEVLDAQLAVAARALRSRPRTKRYASRSPEIVEVKRLREWSPEQENFPPTEELMGTIPSRVPSLVLAPEAQDAPIAAPSVQELIAAERSSGVARVQPWSGDDVLTWRTHICCNVPTSTPESMIAHVHRHGSSETAPPFVAPAGVHLNNVVPVAGLLDGQRTFRIYSTSPSNPAATGQGPERAILVHGLRLSLTDSKRWVDSDGMYKRPLFHSFEGYFDKSIVSAFRVDGAWAALYLIQLGVGPDPLCPFLLIALSQKDREWISSLSLEYIHHLDPSAARALAPWFALKASDTVSMADLHRHPAVMLVMAYVPGVNVSIRSVPLSTSHQYRSAPQRPMLLLLHKGRSLRCARV
ncbi:hypothetical protein R3P38DRAFT_3251804 [Favolaschia claudopus]|uniref:Uncharacterized protein n=1 Tax=Favolaschia claudopus TaxID=2862362 RepID=A0AAW0E586_9AGAR